RAHAGDRVHQPHRKGPARLMATESLSLGHYKGAELGRSTVRASRSAFAALLLRDLTVLRKNLKEFLPRTILQPFLLVFVFLYVFPTIGQAIGGGRGVAGESAFATVLVAGVVGLSIMFQGIQAVALPMVQEFGYTKEIEDRVLAPLPVSLVALAKVATGATQRLVLIKPRIYVTEGFRAALTKAPHMHLYVIYPVLVGFCSLFLWQGVAGFKRRVLT